MDKPLLSRLRRVFVLVFAVLIVGSVFASDTETAGIYQSVDEWLSNTQSLTGSTSDLYESGNLFSDLASLTETGIGQDEAATPPESAGNLSVDRNTLATTLGILVAVLVAVILLLIFISANLVNLVRVREGKEAFTLGGTIKLTKELALNPYIATFGNLVLFIVVLFYIVPVARGVGLHQGYQPDQPIYFSHKIHAGNLEVDCQYCHTGAGLGKNAWIPSNNICWNCHNGVQNVMPGYSPEMETFYNGEIAKVRQAYLDGTPIEWVRIHNLPDLAYFNHQQHVVAGEQECQTCHGPVEEMDEVYQYSPLSMGWCVNCHRETEVRSDYYKDVMGWDHANVVEDIGGLNCARCHY